MSLLMTSVVNQHFKGALGRPFLALAAALVVSCASESEFVVQGEAQGSTFVVRAYGDSLNLSESDVARWLADYNKAVSVWDPQSELSRLNRGETLSPSLILSDLLRMTEGIRVATDSLVEPGLEHVLRAWGFTAGTQLLPSSQGAQRDSVIVDSLMALVQWTAPEVTPQGTRLAHPINVNAFAQGHSVDLVLDSLRARGAIAAFVEIGGEVRCFGLKPNGDPFKVGIEKPLTSGDRSLQLTVELEDRALATSGNYRKFQVDFATGRQYGHSLDPRTGWPAPTDVLSATLIGPSCAEADAYATMAMVLGVERTKQWLAQHPEWDAILIYSDAQGALQIYNSLK
jgi:thiamine biosynthesis lipoprotein